MKKFIKKPATLLTLLFLSLTFTGCEKLTNQARNIQSDIMGLDRQVVVTSCFSGETIAVYKGNIRINEEDASNVGVSLLIDGRKLNISSTHCFVIEELSLIERKSKIYGFGAQQP